MSKCAVCDQRPAPVFIAPREDFYCNDCAAEAIAEAEALLGIQPPQLLTGTPSQQFWDWIAECPKGIYVNHDWTDTEDHQKIHVFGFAVPITEGDQNDDDD